ncbi:MAG TPA: DUF4157 domain-containing protein [Terracidiphilus sp.]
MSSPRTHASRVFRPGEITATHVQMPRHHDAGSTDLDPRPFNSHPANLKAPAFDFRRISIHSNQPPAIGSDHAALNQHNPSGHRLHAPTAEAQLEREAEDAASKISTDPLSPAADQPVPQRFTRASSSRTGSQKTPSTPSGGQPLDTSMLTEFEFRFGSPLSEIRVHTDLESARSARDLDALAYTLGNHIVFDEGQFAPRTPAGRRLLAHELAHVVQQRMAAPVIQRQPKKKDTQPPPRTYPQFQNADQVQELTRDKDDNWEIMISGHISEQSAQKVIWPARLPPSVKIELLVALTDPVELGKFKLSGVRFDSLATMDSSVAKLFLAHGLEDESKVRPDVASSRAAFRKRHSGHGDWGLDAMEVALEKVTKHNPDLLVAYYTYYADHQLADPSWWDEHIGDFDRGKDAGMTSSGDTVINPDVLRLESAFPTNAPLSLLGETLVHEYSHTPQGGSGNAVEQAPKEAKAYAIELFFADRLGDTKRAATIEKRYSGNDPLDLATGGNEIYNRTYQILTELYKIIDNGGPEAEKARKMSVDLISHNETDYGPDLKAFIKNLRK